MKHTLFIAGLVLLLAAGSASAAYQVGDSIADFTLNDSDGQPVNLSDFSGKVVFINFWGSG